MCVARVEGRSRQNALSSVRICMTCFGRYCWSPVTRLVLALATTFEQSDLPHCVFQPAKSDGKERHA